jgi:nitrogen regulatory protein PII
MKNVIKLEIITEKRAIEQVVAIIEKHGVSGHTIINEVTGKGKRGIKHGEDLNDVFKNCMIITVCEESQAILIEADLKDFLKRISGICIVSEVKYLIH